MKEKPKREMLCELLGPFVKEHKEKKNSVSAENVEDLISFAETFQVEDALLNAIRENPQGPFWSYLDVIPDGLASGMTQTELLDDE